MLVAHRYKDPLQVLKFNHSLITLQVVTVPADGLAPKSDRPFIHMVLTTYGKHVFLKKKYIVYEIK